MSSLPFGFSILIQVATWWKSGALASFSWIRLQFLFGTVLGICYDSKAYLRGTACNRLDSGFLSCLVSCWFKEEWTRAALVYFAFLLGLATVEAVVGYSVLLTATQIWS